MPISGLLVTLDQDDHLARDALEAIGREPRVELGERHGRKQAAVVDTATRQDDRRLWAWLNDLPGVQLVDVVFVAFEDDPEASPAPDESKETTPR